MCGIAGIAARRPVRPEAIEAMTEQIAHRGPDGEGTWFNENGNIGFGHRRLAVIDPTPAGAQPMSDPTGEYVITFNGEIYNYLEIAERLRQGSMKSDGVPTADACCRWPGGSPRTVRS